RIVDVNFLYDLEGGAVIQAIFPESAVVRSSIFALCTLGFQCFNRDVKLGISGSSPSAGESQLPFRMKDGFIFLVRRRNDIFNDVAGIFQKSPNGLRAFPETQRPDPHNVSDLTDPVLSSNISRDARHLQKPRSRENSFFVYFVV